MFSFPIHASFHCRGKICRFYASRRLLGVYCVPNACFGLCLCPFALGAAKDKVLGGNGVYTPRYTSPLLMAVLGHSEENFKRKNQKRPEEKQESELSAASGDQVLTGRGLSLDSKLIRQIACRILKCYSHRSRLRGAAYWVATCKGPSYVK